MKTLTDWFDPHNMDHLKAYQHLRETGVWQEGFIPFYVVVDPYWQFSLAEKMAVAWIDHKLFSEKTSS